MFKPQNIQSKILLEHLSTPGEMAVKHLLLLLKSIKNAVSFISFRIKDSKNTPFGCEEDRGKQ